MAQAERLLRLSSAGGGVVGGPDLPISNWPPSVVRNDRFSLISCPKQLESNGSMPDSRVFVRGGIACVPSHPGTKVIGVGLYNDQSLGRPIDDRLRGVVVSGNGSSRSRSGWNSGNLLSPSSPGSLSSARGSCGDESAGASAGGDHGPVFSNGVLVPRPFLWAGKSRGVQTSSCETSGDKNNIGRRAAATSATSISYGGGESNRVRCGTGQSPGDPPSTFSSSPSMYDLAVTQRDCNASVGTVVEGGPRTSGLKGLEGERARLAWSGDLDHQRDRIAIASVLLEDGIETDGKDSGEGAHRLAWCGDRQSLALPNSSGKANCGSSGSNRPSATLQLRRHAVTPKASSTTLPPSPLLMSSSKSNGISSPSSLSSSSSSSELHETVAAAAYLGRLDLSADGGGGGYSAGGGVWRREPVGQRPLLNRSEVWGSSIGDNNGMIYSVEGGVHGSAGIRSSDDSNIDPIIATDGKKIPSRNCSGSVNEDEVAVTTMSSSGMSLTSWDEDEEEESDGEEALMVVDDRNDPDYMDYGVIAGEDGASVGCNNSGDRGGENGERKGDRASGCGKHLPPTGNIMLSGRDKPVEPRVSDSIGVAEESVFAVVLSDGNDDGVEISNDAMAGVGKSTLGRAAATACSLPPSKKLCPRKSRRNKNKGRKKGRSCSGRDCNTNSHSGTETKPVSPTRVSAKPKSRTPSAPANVPRVPPPPPPGPRMWPARPPHRALVYAAAAEASRRSRGFTGWMFPALPPPPPPPVRPPTPPPPPVKDETDIEPTTCPAKGTEGPINGCFEANGAAGELTGRREVKEDQKCSKSRSRKLLKKRLNLKNGLLGCSKDNPAGFPSPNEFGWQGLGEMHTAEGRANMKQRLIERKRMALERIARRKREELEKVAKEKRAELDRRRLELERIAMQKRAEIFEALRIKV